VSRTGCQIQLFSPAPDGTVNWRLLSGNNREAGRGAVPSAGVHACLRDVTALQAAVGRLQPRVRRVEPHHWRWELWADGAAHAVGGHRFDRLIRCQQAMTQFLAEFATAPIRAGLVISGARRWGRAS
jgi:hypothetical protein